jgi:hypothetical protein
VAGGPLDPEQSRRGGPHRPGTSIEPEPTTIQSRLAGCATQSCYSSGRDDTPPAESRPLLASTPRPAAALTPCTGLARDILGQYLYHPGCKFAVQTATPVIPGHGESSSAATSRPEVSTTAGRRSNASWSRGRSITRSTCDARCTRTAEWRQILRLCGSWRNSQSVKSRTERECTESRSAS